MKYCDLDGTKLLREPGSESQDQSRLWSLIGVGVLVGAIVIIAISVLFSPRTPDTPAIARSTPPVSQTLSSQPASPDPSAKPEIVVEETPIAEVKKKEKPLDAANSNSSALNPKAVTKEDVEETEPAKSDSRAEPAKASSEIEKPVVPITGKPRSDGDPSVSKPAQTAADAKADKKKEAEKGKEEKKDEKKKGGLLRVFKKIFGKG